MKRPTAPFTVCAELSNPTYISTQGVRRKEYARVDDIMCSFKTYGGTETTENGVLSVVDTAQVETWYRPDIEAKSRITVNSKVYEVIGEPEDIELRHQFMSFKARRVTGGA